MTKIHLGTPNGNHLMLAASLLLGWADTLTAAPVIIAGEARVSVTTVSVSGPPVHLSQSKSQQETSDHVRLQALIKDAIQGNLKVLICI